ncbi:hypothetical protein SAM9427_36835 (plasmid) [Streptomyces sp. ETH9427]|uniref:hypothetical protein n=1 Tax=Streptomyces sp. E1N211 TaxID=1851876 RepID=UPI000E0BCE6A|nr:hypothetical protein [Streptomyces sp. E1N211]AXI91335.1 hypothetical protein SAM9427_36835 [Streptomyces sp. ETH9427]
MTDQTSPQQPDSHPTLGRMRTSADPAAKRALHERAENYPHISETGWKPRAGSGPVPAADRLAHLGHVEHPAEMYPIMRVIKLDTDAAGNLTAWADGWVDRPDAIASFGFRKPADLQDGADS